MTPKEFVAKKKITWRLLAESIGITPGFISQIVCGRRPWPIAVCVRFEAFSKGLVSRKDLRKDWRDIWPDLS